MRSWDLMAIDLRPSALAILASTDEARAPGLEIPAGGSLQDHQEGVVS